MVKAFFYLLITGLISAFLVLITYGGVNRFFREVAAVAFVLAIIAVILIIGGFR